MNQIMTQICDQLTANRKFGSIDCMSSMTKHILRLLNKRQNEKQITNGRNFYTESPKHKESDNQTKRQTVVKKTIARTETNYDVLGISPTATQREIKSAYYSLSKSCHPDVNQSSEAEEQFREITDAYEVLANRDSKRLYDSTIANHLRPNTDQNVDRNQENLNKYREFSKFKNNSKESEEYDYNLQKWQKRRNIRKENIYKNSSKTEERVRYEDPLRYEPKDYFKDHFDDETQRRYAEHIDKKSAEFQRMVEESNTDAGIKTMALLLIFGFVLLVHVIGEKTLKLSEPSVKVKTNENNNKDITNISRNISTDIKPTKT